MVDEELNKKIADVLKDEREEAPSAYDQVLRKLRDLAKAVEVSLAPGAIHVRIEPGHRVNLGQQYRFVFLVPSVEYRDVLFRAYIPTDGFPVTLDLFDDKHPTCDTLDALETEVIHFLGHRDVKQRLLSLKDVAA
jgi:hypothetical protein